MNIPDLLSIPVAVLLLLNSTNADERPALLPPAAVPLKLTNNASVDAWQLGSQLFLKIPASSDSVRFPRLRNVIRSIELIDSKLEATLKPEPESWIVQAAPGALVAITLDGRPELFDPAVVSESSDNGQIFLPAKSAVTQGKTLRFEPQPHKNTVGYWSDPKDVASWKFRTEAPGIWEVDILQGCGKEHGGSHVQLQAGQQTLEFTVAETGHFQNFIWRTLGKLDLPSGVQTLTLVPLSKKAGAVMDVRAVRLVPPGTRRTMEPELADPESLPQQPGKP